VPTDGHPVKRAGNRRAATARYASARNPQGIGWPPSRSEAASRSRSSSSAGGHAAFEAGCGDNLELSLQRDRNEFFAQATRESVYVHQRMISQTREVRRDELQSQPHFGAARAPQHSASNCCFEAGTHPEDNDQRIQPENGCRSSSGVTSRRPDLRRVIPFAAKALVRVSEPDDRSTRGALARPEGTQGCWFHEIPALRRSLSLDSDAAASDAEGQSAQRRNGQVALLVTDNLSHDPHGAVVTALIEEQSRRIVGPSSLRRRQRDRRRWLPRLDKGVVSDDAAGCLHDA
jgi:hypothetical protein